MNGVYEPETAPCGVANLANSPAICCDPRLAGDRFESHSRSLRINQRFPNSIGCFEEACLGRELGSLSPYLN